MFAVQKYSKNDIGKIILRDGSLISRDKYDMSSALAVAIVWNVANDGSYALGIGIYTTKTAWANTDCYGCFGRIEKLENLKDGSKALSYVKDADPVGARNLARNYPALHFADTYGKCFNVGKFSDGWYIPTFEELGDEFNLVSDNFWRQFIDTFKLFNDKWPPFIWCSNSTRQQNSYSDYDSWSANNHWQLPRDMKYSLNRLSIWVEIGWFEYYNFTKFDVLVMRKFY